MNNNFPIYGVFRSKRGTYWNFKIYEDLSVEQWHKTKVRCEVGWKSGADVYSPHCTKELRQHIKDTYGLEVKA